MEIRYVDKVIDNKVMLSLLTDNYDDSVEKHKVVDVSELQELRKTMVIYGYNAITGSVKVLTQEEVRKMYSGKQKLVGRNPNNEIDITADVTSEEKGEINFITINLTVSNDSENAYIYTGLLIDWHKILNKLIEVLNSKEFNYKSFSYKPFSTISVTITFDIGNYEILDTAPFSLYNLWHTYKTVYFKSIEFSDNTNLKYTKEIRNLFHPLKSILTSNYINAYSDAFIDLSNCTLERIETMENLFTGLPLNIKMPKLQIEKQPNLKNIVNQVTYNNVETLVDTLNFAVNYAENGISDLVSDYLIIKELKLSEVEKIDNLFVGKDYLENCPKATVVVNKLILDCEITEGMFSNIKTVQFVVYDVDVEPTFNMQGYSAQVALDTIYGFSGFKVSLTKDTTKSTGYRVSTFQSNCIEFLTHNVVTEGIKEVFKGNLFCPKLSRGCIGNTRLVRGANDINLAIIFMSLIFQKYAWKDKSYTDNLSGYPYYYTISKENKT